MDCYQCWRPAAESSDRRGALTLPSPLHQLVVAAAVVVAAAAVVVAAAAVAVAAVVAAVAVDSSAHQPLSGCLSVSHQHLVCHRRGRIIDLC